MALQQQAEERSEHGTTLGMRGYTYPAIVNRLRKGFSYKTYLTFQQKSRLDGAAVARVMHVPPRTMARRKREGAFKPEESERLLRLSRIYEQTLDLFEGDGEAARRWLDSPAKALAGQSPLVAAETEIGAQEVERLIGRIEHGVVA
jgi:putative toxin-antitoxin system antitoxin component (TIGR02293 family)